MINMEDFFEGLNTITLKCTGSPTCNGTHEADLFSCMVQISIVALIKRGETLDLERLMGLKTEFLEYIEKHVKKDDWVSHWNSIDAQAELVADFLDRKYGKVLDDL